MGSIPIIIVMVTTMLAVDRDSLITKSTASALFTLIESGLPKAQALTKLGINGALRSQINKIAEKYIGYFAEGEDVYQEKIERNSPKMQAYIEACVDLHISCERADSEFADRVVQSITAGIDENPELALKVAERRWSDEWGAKKQTDVKIDTTSTIKTIQINIPTGETVDADYAEVED